MTAFEGAVELSADPQAAFNLTVCASALRDGEHVLPGAPIHVVLCMVGWHNACSYSDSEGVVGATAVSS